MSEKLTLVEYDASTGVEIIRELNSQELKDIESVHTKEIQRKQEAEAKIAARTSALAKLAALGLTEEEIGAL
jgi:hypothetical protein